MTRLAATGRQLVVVLAFLTAAPVAAAAQLTWSGPVALETTGGPAYLNAVACPSAGQCTAVDRLGCETTFDPTRRARRRRPSSTRRLT